MTTDIMLRGIIVTVVAREPPIVWTQRHETRLKYVIFPRIFHEMSVPESNATSEAGNKHGGLDLTELLLDVINKLPVNESPYCNVYTLSKIDIMAETSVDSK